MSSLAACPPRCFSKRRVPAYPVAASFALLVVTSCRPAAKEVVVLEEPADTATAGPSSTTAAMATTSRPAAVPATPRNAIDGIADAQRAGEFTEDRAALDMNASCKGDCPTPFQLALMHKDRAQVSARLKWCAAEARKRGPLPAVGVTVRGDVDAQGRPTSVKLDSLGTDERLPDDVARCLRELVEDARFAPGDASPGSRILYVEAQMKADGG
jgi:hypothetical protein